MILWRLREIDVTLAQPRHVSLLVVKVKCSYGVIIELGSMPCLPLPAYAMSRLRNQIL